MSEPTLVTEGISLRNAFGDALVSLAPNYQFFVTDNDVAGGTGVFKFREKYPERFIQCGITEQATMGIAAGLSATTRMPIFYSTFAVFGARAWEIFRLSIAYAQRNVKVVLSHTGLDVGPDGASAQSLEHYAIWRSIPGISVIQPADPYEVLLATEQMLINDGPMVMFTGRSNCPTIYGEGHEFTIGKASYATYYNRPKVVIIATGVTVARARDAVSQLSDKHNIRAAVINMSTIKPVDVLAIKEAVLVGKIVIVEDHSYYGGLGGAIAEVMMQQNWSARVKHLAVGSWGKSGEPDELAADYYIDTNSICEACVELVRG